MPPTIYFRADGSQEIGLGHLVRSIALANMLKEQFSITFFCKKAPPDIIADIIYSGFGFQQIESEDFFFEKLNSEDIVVLDGYRFNINYQARIKNSGCILVCIDDIHDQELMADLIINHSPGVVPSDYTAQLYTKFALGIDYALLRPSFLQQAKKSRHIGRIETALICFGGSDYKNLTLSTLETLITIDRFKKINVITGNAYSGLDSLNAFIVKDDRINHYHAVNEEEMLNLMLESDLAIVPASGILLEVLAVGTKVISGYYIDNQKVVFENLKNMNAFESAEGFDDKNLRIALNKVFENKDIESLRVIDGNSDKRNLYNFLELKSKIRNAEFKDCLMMFDWVNDIDVRKNAISKDPIIWDTHVNWFISQLNSDRTKIYIFEFNNQPIGQIRFEKHENFWLIDYSIICEYRGLGFGKVLLKDTLPLFNNYNIRAIVSEKNIASQKVFLSLNFKKISTEIINKECFFTYEYLR